MEDVIKKIISIENKAQKVINMAEQEKINKRNDLKDRLDALEKKLNSDAERKIEQLRKRELSEAREEAAGKRESCTGKLKMIEQYGKDNHDTWVENLFNMVIRGE